ncbi:MAG: hypothetical protein IJK22_09405 [Bacteroidales bacterium]|nr:hypothetical protein [Bacteroidales bacterium]
MKKILTFVIAALFGMGLYAQVPDNSGVVVCEVPSTLDSLRGETPVCPALGTPTVVLNESTKKVQFSVPITGGTSFDGVEGHFTVTIDGVNGIFFVAGTFNSNHSTLSGSVSVNGDNAMSGLDLRDRTLHTTAVITGCHAADAQDPTSSDGVVSETVTYTVPAECLFVFGTSSYQRQNNGNYSFRANFSGSANAISNQRFIIQNADGNIVATIPGNIIGNAITAMVGVSAMTTTYGLTVGSYTAIPTVDPAYSSCPSTGQPMSFEILPACTAFDSVVVYTDGQQYQLRAYIDLTALEIQNPQFDITATTGQYAGGSAWYVDPSRHYIATPMTALPTQQTVLQATASVEARCGVDLVDNGYVTITSASVTLTIPMACPAFYGTEDALSNSAYRMLSHINLNGGYDYQQTHFVVKTGADSSSVSATYSSSSLEMASAWISTTQNFPWANQTITLYPVVEVKCGLSSNNYVTITGPAISRSFASCPTLGDVYLTSNQASNPNLRADTLFAEIENYTSSMIHRVVFSVTRVGSSTTLQWEADGWNAAHGAAYKVLALSLLQQLGLSTTDIVATVDVTMEVNANSQGCQNATVSGTVVTLTALAECPSFSEFAVTTPTKDYDGNISVTTPVQYYNPALIHHTGVMGQDSLYYTIYVNTTGTDQPGSEASYLDAVYDAQTQMMTCTIPSVQVIPGARYDFVPHINLDAYCNSASNTYITIDGPSGYLVIPLVCPSYSATTNAVVNADGSVMVTHQMVNFSPSLINPQGNHRVRVSDANGALKFNYSTNVVISDAGLFTCTIPASSLAAYSSQYMKFRPQVYLSNPPCSSLGNGPASDIVCIPYIDLPSFTAVSNSDGMGKITLFSNEGVVLSAKIVGNGTFAMNQVAQAGYLLSRSPITEYNAEMAVVGTIGSSTGDTLTYTVGMDSCGGITYYRPYLIMNGCDQQIVLGEQHSFEMWAPNLTVSANPEHVAAGGSVTLTALATMNVGTWDQHTSNGVPCTSIVSFTNNCGFPYSDDCSTTKPMETWMYLLVNLRACDNFWNSFSSLITNNLGMDPGNADFQYRWEQNGTVFFSTASSSDSGVTTVNPTSTTTYTGVADFSYNDVHCVQKANVTVQVP